MGVAQVFDDWAIPFFFRASSGVGELVLFAASQSVSARFAALVNTGITPVHAGTETAPLAPHLWDGVPGSMAYACQVKRHALAIEKSLQNF